MNVEMIRNVALIGHSGEGKTTLAEAILFNMGVTDRQGKVEDGNTVMDFDPIEVQKKSSISLACATGEYKGYKFNIIDVPGYYDFESELAQALAVALVVIISSISSTVLPLHTLRLCTWYTPATLSSLSKNPKVFWFSVSLVFCKTSQSNAHAIPCAVSVSWICSAKSSA